MYGKTNDPITEIEQIRLDEITFYKYIQFIFKINPNPIRVYEFIEILGSMTECNIIIMNSIVSDMMCEGNKYKANKQEYIYLLSKSRLTVRAVCARLKITQKTYYQNLYKEDLVIKHNITKEQHEELVKFLVNINIVIPERI